MQQVCKPRVTGNIHKIVHTEIQKEERKLGDTDSLIQYNTINLSECQETTRLLRTNQILRFKMVVPLFS